MDVQPVADRAMARSIIFEEFDMVTTVEEIKQALMLHLGYSDRGQ